MTERVTLEPIMMLCGGTAESYCYRDLDVALRAAATWNGIGDPIDGWHRSPTNGRRRDDGDPTREYHRW